jgi:hypothetical protein
MYVQYVFVVELMIHYMPFMCPLPLHHVGICWTMLESFSPVLLQASSSYLWSFLIEIKRKRKWKRKKIAAQLCGE